MNLIMWLLAGAFLGAMTGSWFVSTGLFLGFFVTAVAGALVGGYLATYFRPERSAKDLDPHTFSPGALIWVVFVSIVFLVIFYSIFV